MYCLHHQHINIARMFCSHSELPLSFWNTKIICGILIYGIMYVHLTKYNLSLKLYENNNDLVIHDRCPDTDTDGWFTQLQHVFVQVPLDRPFSKTLW